MPLLFESLNKKVTNFNLEHIYLFFNKHKMALMHFPHPGQRGYLSGSPPRSGGLTAIMGTPRVRKNVTATPPRDIST